MTQASDREDVDYRTDGFAPIELDVPEDNLTAGSLQLLLDIFNVGASKCSDMNSIDLKHSKLTAEQQVFAYQFALNEIVIPIQSQLEDLFNRLGIKYHKNK